MRLHQGIQRTADARCMLKCWSFIKAIYFCIVVMSVQLFSLFKLVFGLESAPQLWCACILSFLVIVLTNQQSQTQMIPFTMM